MPLVSRDHPLSPARAWSLAGLLVVGTVAIFMRTWSLGAILATSDQASMAWMVRHNFGFKWLSTHPYGPVVPFIQRSWAELLYRLDLPIAGEIAVRAPIALASLLQVAVTFALVRRLGRTRVEAGLCSIICAIVPTLVSDAHFAWGYNTLWLLNGTIALWATLAWLQDDRPRLLLLAGIGLMLHCLSNCFAFALPVTLLYVWTRALRSGSRCGPTEPMPASQRQALRRAFSLGFVMPCLAALAFIVVCWALTGEGQFGRLAFKREIGSTGLRLTQFLNLPEMWATQFGYLFGVAAAIGLIRATLDARSRVLSVWCWASLLPILLFVDWSRVGYLAAYLLECAYAAGLLGALWICSTYQRLERRSANRAVFACSVAALMLHMAIASFDSCFTGGKLFAWTGVPVSWGSVRPESGIKAAGWYVRRHVPAKAIVMAAHTNTGMEGTVAEYYCGRVVVAGYDLQPEAVEPLVREMHGSVDVLIIEPSWCELADSLPGFERTATFRHEGRAVRYVYARPELRLQQIDEAAEVLNARYDRECISRKVPQVRTEPAAMEDVFRHYQQAVAALRVGPIRVAD